jgi:hypothetical protein
MIGLGTLHHIDQRLRQIFPGGQDESPGSLNVLLLVISLSFPGDGDGIVL